MLSPPRPWFASRDAGRVWKPLSAAPLWELPLSPSTGTNPLQGMEKEHR